MARLFATSINLNKNELQNARIQNLSSNPSSPVAGQIYFNTTDNELRYYDGSQWISGSSVEFGDTASRPASSKAGQIYVDTEAKVIYVDNGTSWVQGTVSSDDVAGWIEDHSDLTTGVHGVTGNVVGTSDTQTLSNKTISDNLHFNDGTAAGYITGDTGNLIIHGNNEVEIIANTDLTLTTDSGNIILNPDGNAYIGNAGSSNNRIATIGDLNSSEVVQSVSGTFGEIDANTDVNGEVKLSLPDSVHVHSTLYVGVDADNETYQDGQLYVKKTDGSNSFAANSEGAIVNGELEIQDGSGNQKLTITHSYTGTTRITTGDDLALRSNDGDIILYPGNDNGGTGKAYVHWGNDATSANPQNEITTAGNTQTFTNKTVSGSLDFVNPSTTPVDGQIYVNDSTEDFVVVALTEDLRLESSSGDIVLSPDGTTYVQSQLNVSGNTNTPTVAGYALNGADGSLRLQDGNGDSQIHINGVSKDIELLPVSGSKAFYGSAATAGNEIARLSDVQATSSGLSWKQAVNLLVDTNISDLTNIAGTYDGHPVTTDDSGYRFLLTGQTTDSENGIYVASVISGNLALTRSSDADAYSELVGAALFVMEGTQYGSTSWVQSNHYITDFTNQDWVQFSGQGTYVGSDSIQVDGNQINAIVNTTHGLYIDGDGISVKVDGTKGLGFNGSGEIQVTLGAGLAYDGSGYLTNDTANGYGVRKFTATIGDNSATSFNLDHNFDTRHVTVQIFEASSPYAQIEADVEHSTLNRVVVRFASAPTTGQYEVVIVG